MKIHIVGASCAGSTTLGEALSRKLGIPYYDTDYFFWEPSEVPYTLKRERLARSLMIDKAISATPDFIIGGSLVSWGAQWLSTFDLVVFLYVPTIVRMERLVNRELERYGRAIYDDKQRNQLFRDFQDWAARYDDPTFSGRNISVHQKWLGEVSCPVVEIQGDTSVEERLTTIQHYLDRHFGK